MKLVQYTTDLRSQQTVGKLYEIPKKIRTDLTNFFPLFKTLRADFGVNLKLLFMFKD